METLKEMPKPTPRSHAAIVEILRGWLERAYDDNITYLEIQAIVDGEKRSISFACKPD